MQIRTIIIALLFIVIALEIISQFYIYFYDGICVNVKDILENLPQHFPDNFYVILLKEKNPHFYNFIFLFSQGNLYLKNNLSNMRMESFRGYKIRKDICIYGKSSDIILNLAFWSFENSLNFPKSLKISGTGEISYNGEINPIIGLDLKLSVAKRNGINVMFLPFSQREDIDYNGIVYVYSENFEDAKRDLLKFVLPKVGITK